MKNVSRQEILEIGMELKANFPNPKVFLESLGLDGVELEEGFDAVWTEVWANSTELGRVAPACFALGFRVAMEAMAP